MSEIVSQCPHLNEAAPDFKVTTTRGDRNLADYKGKWLILFSYLAWTRNIKEKFGVHIRFPIIEDIKMEVASAYDMVHPGATARNGRGCRQAPRRKLQDSYWYCCNGGVDRCLQS